MTTEATAEVAVQAPNPMMLIQQALDKGAGIDVVERMVALQKDIREYEAKVAFDGALHRVQRQVEAVRPTVWNEQTKSHSADFASLDKVLRPLYSAEMFSLSYDNADSPLVEHARVLAYLSREGHTRKYQMDVPCDGLGPKGTKMMSKIHAVGAAQTYGRRYLLVDIFNIPILRVDTDGNAPNGPKMPDTALTEALDYMEVASSLADLRKFYGFAHEDAVKIGDMDALRRIIAAWEKGRAKFRDPSK